MSRFDAVGRIGICLLVGGILVSGVVMETTPRVRESQIVSIIFLPPAIPGQRMLPDIFIIEDNNNCRDNGNNIFLVNVFEDVDVFKTSGKD